MSKKIENLTTEQKVKLEEYKNLYLGKFFNTSKEADIKEVTEYVNWLYEFCNLKKPVTILVNSPFEALIAYQQIKKYGINIDFENVVFDKSNEKLEWVDVSWYLSSFNSWLSFYNYFHDNVLELEEADILKQYSKVLDLNIFWGLTLEGVCIVSKNAVDYQRNSNFQLHSVNKAAITFPGNEFQYKMYFVQGVGISEELFNRLSNKEYTFEEWSKEQNEEIKSLVLAFYEEKFGGEFVYRFLSKHLVEKDTYIDKKNKQYLEKTTNGMNIGVYTLFKGNVNKIDVAYVRCYCPSTDRMFFLGVHPDMNNAKDAIASLCQVPVKLKDNLVSIKRQGEIFSFNFDKKGTKILKNKELTKEDYQNVVSLLGNEYFSKLQFEY